MDNLNQSTVDTILSVTVALPQVFLLLIALILTIVGLLFLGNALGWRLRAERVEGTVIGVRVHNNCYFPVYSYSLPTGETYEATADSGSSLVKGKETYRKVRLLAFRDEPLKVRPANSFSLDIIALCLLIPGAALLRFSLTFFPLTLATAIVFAAILLVIAVYFYKLPRRNAGAKTKLSSKRMETLQKLPVRPIEDILASPEEVEKKAQAAKDARTAAPFILILAAIILYGAYTEYNKMSSLEKHGTRTEGDIVQIKTEKNKKGQDLYYPSVTFQDVKGKTYTFTPRDGAIEPLYTVNQKLGILYFESDPQKSARIDYGRKEKMIPVVLLTGLGLLIFLIFLRVMI